VVVQPASVCTFTNNALADGILKLNVGIGGLEALSLLEACEEVIASIVANYQRVE
jgi:hypothetical protein